jgi:hypothetical protein
VHSVIFCERLLGSNRNVGCDDYLDLLTNAVCDKQETFVKILKNNSTLLSKSQIPSVKKERHKQW